MKERLEELAKEIGNKSSEETSDEMFKAIEMLNNDLVTDLTIEYPEIEAKFEFKVKAVDLETQILLEQINFETAAERKRFIVQKCVISPKLSVSIINKMPMGMIDAIVATVNVLAFSCTTRVDLSVDLPSPLRVESSGEYVSPSASRQEK